MDTVIWNSPHSMPQDAKAAFSNAGGWDDDCDWVMFVPNDNHPPRIVFDNFVNAFQTTKGVFYAAYHS